MTSPSSLDPARPDTSDGPVARAAARLITAGGDRAPCAPVRDEIGAADVEAAYAVQQILHRRALDAGREVSGRKIGLTSRTMQQAVSLLFKELLKSRSWIPALAATPFTIFQRSSHLVYWEH